MYTDNHPDLRKVVNNHLGPNAGEATKTTFEKAKSEIILTKTALSKTINLLTMEKYLDIVGQDAQTLAPGVKNAVDMVDSYYIPLPSESIAAAFTRAKRESIAKLKQEIAQMKYFSFKEYSVKKKKMTAVRKVRTTNFDNVRVEKRKSPDGN